MAIRQLHKKVLQRPEPLVNRNIFILAGDISDWGAKSQDKDVDVFEVACNPAQTEMQETILLQQIVQKEPFR